MKRQVGDLIYDAPNEPFRRGEHLWLKRNPEQRERVVFLERLKNGRCKVVNRAELIESVFEFELER